MQVNTLHPHSSRLVRALLASLLLHLAIVGDLAKLQWWRPFAATDRPSALDVQLLPAPASGTQRSQPAGEPAVPEPPPQAILQPPPVAEMLALEPIPESFSAAEPQQTSLEQGLTAGFQAIPAPPAVTANDESMALRLPSNGKLTYRFFWGKSRWLAGQAVHQWLVENNYYSLTSTVSTTGVFQLLHPLKLVETSKGKISGDKLRPLQFSTQLNEYPPAVAIFDWEKNRYRWFRGQATFTQPLPKDSYDKISYLYQLYLAAQKEDYVSAEITMGRHLEHYDILNLGLEDLEIDGSIHQSVHLRGVSASPEREKVDIWLATDMNYLPLKMTYANQAGDHFEQLIAAESLPGQ